MTMKKTKQMIYTDTKDDDEENKTRKESAIELFKAFDRG